MTYVRTSKAQNFAQTAFTKLWVKFTDGQIRIRHSRDKRNDKALPDRVWGILRLKKLVYDRKQFVEIAIIYDNVSGAEICRFDHEKYWKEAQPK
jgi:hypothetical protein